jgi:flagellum-specific peptidoglycan hydrolase FlgJ
MVKTCIWLTIAFSGTSPAWSASAPEFKKQFLYEEYIHTYYKTAIRLQKKYKIPASIILAQALLESGAGQSFLALGGNNHFGIKCSEWQGLRIQKRDDGQLSCFRKYLHAIDSFEDHSRFLANRSYYRPLFKLSRTDYKGWARGLKQCGYATDPQYSAKLINLIEYYRLYYYDTAKESDPPAWTNNKATTSSPKYKNINKPLQ